MNPLPAQFCDRIPLQFGNRAYPVARRTESAPLSPSFQKVHTSMGSWLTMPPVTTKADAFRVYNEKLAQLQDAAAETNTFLEAVSRARMPNGGTPDRVLALQPYPQPKAVGVELAVQPLPTIVSTMNGILPRAAWHLLAEVQETFDDMVEEKQMGLIRFPSRDTAQYCYYTHHDDTTVTGQRHRTQETATTRTYTTETDRQRVVSLAFHQHDLIDIHVEKFRELPKCPRRILALPEKIPAFLRPFVYLVQGQLIRELTLEVELKREQWTDAATRVEAIPQPVVIQRYHPDPALVIGHYVFAGWKEDEV